MELNRKISKKQYQKEIREAAFNNGYLLIKQMAQILDVSTSTIKRAIDKGWLGSIRMGPENSRCQIRIPIGDALIYVENFIVSTIQNRE